VKILLAEDDDISRHILRETVRRWGYDVVTADDGLEAWRLLQEKDAPKLAILDWIMPGMDGIDVCRRIRDEIKEPYVYVLLLTSKSEKQDIIEGMGAGADDYILKPFDPQELRMRLSAGRRIIELQAQLLATRESLRYHATHDSLTGLSNRGEILDRLQRELNRASREQSSVAVIMVDVDHFKSINDSYGHIAGDMVLAELAERMRKGIRSYDAVGRYGGEEFLIILPGCNATNALKHAERLREMVTSEPVVLADSSVFVTVSLGVVAKPHCELEDLNCLIRAADSALYRAKSGGRNQVVLGDLMAVIPE
jgi:diguanylate cyclase (GGDEF)-like protein